MVSKKNLLSLRRSRMERKTVYALRKVSLGLVSAALATCFLAPQVLAEEVVTPTTDPATSMVESLDPTLPSTGTSETTTPTSTDPSSTTTSPANPAEMPATDVTTADPATPEASPGTSSTESATSEPSTEETTLDPTADTGAPAEAPKEQTVGNDPTLADAYVKIVQDATFGQDAKAHIEYLSEEIGSRVVGTEGEAKARAYIKEQLESYGYTVTEDPFTFTRKGVEYQSSNLIAVKKGNSTDEVIVGAHYDSVASGGSLGADDNASGVGVVLEMAKRIVNVPTLYTFRFIAFGAEEMGLQGSKHYAQAMTEDQVAATKAMINLDSLIAGDKMYIHAGLGGKYWVRDQAFDMADKLGIKGMEPNPGLNKEYPYGETGDWSDHAPFNALGIPIMYFEGTNWEIGELDGYDQTADNGPIFHTGKDNLTFLNETYPGRVDQHLHDFSATLYNLMINMLAPGDLAYARPIYPSLPPVVQEDMESGNSGQTPGKSEVDGKVDDKKDDKDPQLVTISRPSSGAKDAKVLPNTGVGGDWSLLGLGLAGLASALLKKKK